MEIFPGRAEARGHGERGARAYNWGLWQSPSGVQRQIPWSGGEMPLKMKALKHLQRHVVRGAPAYNGGLGRNPQRDPEAELLVWGSVP